MLPPCSYATRCTVNFRTSPSLPGCLDAWMGVVDSCTLPLVAVLTGEHRRAAVGGAAATPAPVASAAPAASMNRKEKRAAIQAQKDAGSLSPTASPDEWQARDKVLIWQGRVACAAARSLGTYVAPVTAKPVAAAAVVAAAAAGTVEGKVMNRAERRAHEQVRMAAHVLQQL